MMCKMNICPLAELEHLDPLIFHYFPVLEVRCSQCGNVQEFPLMDLMSLKQIILLTKVFKKNETNRKSLL